MHDITIKIRENGPYLVKGPISLFDADGAAYTIAGESIALCRCGQSQTKPFCDGSHKSSGFVAAERVG